VLTRDQREEFGGYLRGLRQGERMSLRYVHRATGISPGYLSLIETGERNPPQPAFLRKLAACYEVPVSALLYRAGHLEEAEVAAEPESVPETAGWPWALEKATCDPFNYALGLRNGAVITFTEATLTAAGWVLIAEPKILAGPGASVYERSFTFERGMEVRVDEIAWVVDAPWGS
jgi:transcriptional regulator with XRE-family HTH domain